MAKPRAKANLLPLDRDMAWRKTPVDRLGFSDAELLWMRGEVPIDTAADVVAWFDHQAEFLDRIGEHLTRYRQSLSNDQIHDFDAFTATKRID